jgi:hypothetical protein
MTLYLTFDELLNGVNKRLPVRIRVPMSRDQLWEILTQHLASKGIKVAPASFEPTLRRSGEYDDVDVEFDGIAFEIESEITAPTGVKPT